MYRWQHIDGSRIPRYVPPVLLGSEFPQLREEKDFLKVLLFAGVRDGGCSLSRENTCREGKDLGAEWSPCALGEGVPKQHGPSHRVMQQSHSMHVRQGSGNVSLARPLSLRLECDAGSTSDLRNAGTPHNCGVLKHPCPIPALGVIHNRVTQMFSQSWEDSAGD